MHLRALVSLLACDVVCGELALDREFLTCFAADLMSDVLAFSSAQALLITGLATIQSVHTADVAECSGILLVSGKRPAADALQLGLVKDIPILSTARSMFEVCGMLYEHGLRARQGSSGIPPSGAANG
jgi:predicted transcriptional regulator